MRIRWWWALFLVPILAGLARLHFDTEVLDLLPPDVPAVQGLKLYQQHFSNARELLATIQAPDAETASAFARDFADTLTKQPGLTSSVFWQPPWQEHPEQTAELIGYLWLNQPPEKFRALAAKLSPAKLPDVLAAARDRLSTTLSPDEIARLGYDPMGLTELPQNSAAPGPGRGDDFFTSSDGTFRVVFIKANRDLPDYEACLQWLAQIDHWIGVCREKPGFQNVSVGYTGRPAFVAEISSGMRHDITFSVFGTSVIIAVLFWLAHRRLKPMLWLLTLLALILAATLALGGLIFGVVNIISMGFAAILLGLAVDYAVVHYQEALAHPDRSIPEIRRAIAPAIFWAAVTTISAFFVLNFSGLPGLAQLGSLVAIGVVLAALVMIFAYLPPLFPERMSPTGTPVDAPAATSGPVHARFVFAVTAAVILICGGILSSGLPGMDKGGDALQMHGSRAVASLNAIKKNLGQSREPLCLVAAGGNEAEVAAKLDALQPILENAVSNQTLVKFESPTALWPHPEFQQANRVTAGEIIGRWDSLRQAVITNGFEESSLGLAEGVRQTWQRAVATTNVFWPTNTFCDWIFERIAARDTNQLFAAAFLYPSPRSNEAAILRLESQWPRDGIWLSGWERLGGTVLGKVMANLWKLLLPMAGLVLLSLWLAFRRPAEILLSLSILLLSGWGLLAVMRVCHWQWNLLNLMALPLILGTGVDYSIFMQLALRRYHGDLRMAYRSVGRALLLCGATAVAGFGSLGFSTNAGMAGLGRVCAIGIAGNVLISVFLLPVWWKFFAGRQSQKAPSSPSRFYGADVWKLGLTLARIVPGPIFYAAVKAGAAVYCRFATNRRKIVSGNLLPVMKGDGAAADRAT
ncbi:MAG TPA: MMPL family transporter, partial [Desulfuromonadaceae bacterium]|nr:MMPL family transporter [Desulfuromonadaceae bacterium]